MSVADAGGRSPVIEHPAQGPDAIAFGPDWVRRYFVEVDRMDGRALMDWYADDAVFRFANRDPVIGRDAIRGLLDDQRLLDAA